MLTITHRSLRTHPLSVLTLAAALLASSPALHAQSATESLGPADSHGKVKGTPLLQEMKTLTSAVQPSLAGQHPRVYFTTAELDTLRMKLHGPAAAEWTADLANLRVFRGDPAPASRRKASCTE